MGGRSLGGQSLTVSGRTLTVDGFTLTVKRAPSGLPSGASC